MDGQSNWSPMRWPDGPFWNEPAALDLVKDTPINCLVVRWSAGLEPLVQEARRRGLVVVDQIAPFPDRPKTGLAVIPWVDRAGFARQTAAPVVAVTDNVWPAVKVTRKGGADAADAGPTGVPWIDSNGWFVQLARTLAPESTVWVVADPPPQQVISRPGAYVLAAADAALYGGRWVVSLDADFTGALASGNARARADWAALTNALRFFDNHREWHAYRSVGVLGVLSDFSGANEFLSTETLNLVGRRHLPYRVLVKSKASPASLSGLKAVVYTDGQLPAPSLRQALAAFVSAGGLLICHKVCAPLSAGGRLVPDVNPRFQVYRVGAGRVAVSSQADMDPFVLANDAHILLSRRHDLVRLWNPGAATSYYAVSPDGRKAVFELLKFSSGPSLPLSVQFDRPYRSARFWTLEPSGPAALELLRKDSSVEAHVPAFSAFCAIELEV